MNFERVRRTRLEKGLSQQKLARAAGVPRSQLQIVEAGGNVTLETLEKLLRPLGLVLVAVSAEELEAAGKALREVDGYLAALAANVAGGVPPPAANDEPTVHTDATTLDET